MATNGGVNREVKASATEVCAGQRVHSNSDVAAAASRGDAGAASGGWQDG
jgi:hypothetical protein